MKRYLSAWMAFVFLLNKVLTFSSVTSWGGFVIGDKRELWHLWADTQPLGWVCTHGRWSPRSGGGGSSLPLALLASRLRAPPSHPCSESPIEELGCSREGHKMASFTAPVSKKDTYKKLSGCSRSYYLYPVGSCWQSLHVPHTEFRRAREPLPQPPPCLLGAFTPHHSDKQ